jgi:hypothetical protein
MAAKRTIRFHLASSPSRRFVVGKSLRFTWQDLYLAIDTLKNRVRGKLLKEILASFLSNGREVTHAFLWKAIELLKKEKMLDTDDAVKACAWVMAAYGYMHGCSTNEDGTGSFPHPAPIRYKKLRKLVDFRDKLVCPVCGHRYKIQKRLKNKAAIYKAYGSWMKVHMREIH